MSIILKNTTYIDWESLEFSKTHILVEESMDRKLKFLQEIPQNNPDDTVIDCEGKFVTKSFAVGHHHVYSALSRGMPAPKKAPANFKEVLEYIWWNLDKALDKEMIEASALATAIACAKAGSTFVIDHHASPNFIEGSLDIITQAFEKVGVNHLLCYEITDRDGKDKAEKGLLETENYIKNKQGLVGLHASFTVGNDTLQKAIDLMEKYDSGIHIHMAEDAYDQKHCQEKYNKRVVERMNDYGVLNSAKTILGHCLHIDKNERELIKNSNAWVVQNMESNLNNNVGYFNAEGLGNRILLGTDGMHSDMIRSAQAAFFVGQGFDTIDFVSAYKRFRNVHRYLEQNKFKGDSANNLVVLDYDAPTEMNASNFLGHFIYGLSSKHVKHVISNGKLIVKDTIVQTINEVEIQKYTKEQANRLWTKL